MILILLLSKEIIILLIALLAVYNLVVFCIYGYDKRCAIKDKWRVPEKVLIGLAFLGGSVGASVGGTVSDWGGTCSCCPQAVNRDKVRQSAIKRASKKARCFY